MNEMNWIERLVLFVLFSVERWKGFRLGSRAISGRGYIRKEWDDGWQMRLIGPSYFSKSKRYATRKPFILYKKNAPEQP